MTDRPTKPECTCTWNSVDDPPHAASCPLATPPPVGEESTGGQDGAAFIKRLINAWDCCGTCAGGVLAERDRRIVAAALVEVQARAERTERDLLKVMRVVAREQERARAAERLASLRGERIERALDRHRKEKRFHQGISYDACGTCVDGNGDAWAWPCPTVRALADPSQEADNG